MIKENNLKEKLIKEKTEKKESKPEQIFEKATTLQTKIYKEIEADLQQKKIFKHLNKDILLCYYLTISMRNIAEKIFLSEIEKKKFQYFIEEINLGFDKKLPEKLGFSKADIYMYLRPRILSYQNVIKDMDKNIRGWYNECYLIQTLITKTNVHKKVDALIKKDKEAYDKAFNEITETLKDEKCQTKK